MPDIALLTVSSSGKLYYLSHYSIDLQNLGTICAKMSKASDGLW